MFLQQLLDNVRLFLSVLYLLYNMPYLVALISVGLQFCPTFKLTFTLNQEYGTIEINRKGRGFLPNMLAKSTHRLLFAINKGR